MAHLWFSSPDSSWSLLPLSGAAIALGSLPAGLLPSPVSAAPWARARLAPLSPAVDSPWALIAPPDGSVRVNGLTLSTGIRVLADRDEIRAAGVSFYFSTEVLARVEPLPPTPEPVPCPRCGQAILAGSPAVQCPRCHVRYHQSNELPCWTYAETCMFCPQPTDLSAGFRWTPHALVSA